MAITIFSKLLCHVMLPTRKKQQLMRSVSMMSCMSSHLAKQYMLNVPPKLNGGPLSMLADAHIM